MNDREKTKEQLIDGLKTQRQRVGKLEAVKDDGSCSDEAFPIDAETCRNLIERANDGIIIVQDSRIKFSNQQMAMMLGCTVDEIFDTFYKDYLHPDEVNRVTEMYNRRISGEVVVKRYETILRHKDGTDLDVEVNAGIIFYNGKYADFVFVRDITEKKQIEKSLRESEEKYRLLVENGNDAIFIAQDEALKFCNHQTEKFTGFSKLELSKIPFVELIHPEDRQIVIERHKKRLSGENPPSTYAFRVINKAGNERWVQLSTMRITWHGRPATLNFLRDIDEQKRLEDRLQHVQKMEAIGTLAGGVAHDFNNLLMGIQGNVSLMSYDLEASHPHCEYLNNIEKLVRGAAELTNQLLGYARKGKSHQSERSG